MILPISFWIGLIVAEFAIITGFFVALYWLAIRPAITHWHEQKNRYQTSQPEDLTGRIRKEVRDALIRTKP